MFNNQFSISLPSVPLSKREKIGNREPETVNCGYPFFTIKDLPPKPSCLRLTKSDISIYSQYILKNGG